MKKKNYSFEEKVDYYKKLRKKGNARAVGFLSGVDYANMVRIKNFVSSSDCASEIREGFYAGVTAYKNDLAKKRSKK